MFQIHFVKGRGIGKNPRPRFSFEILECFAQIDFRNELR